MIELTCEYERQPKVSRTASLNRHVLLALHPSTASDKSAYKKHRIAANFAVIENQQKMTTLQRHTAICRQARRAVLMGTGAEQRAAAAAPTLDQMSLPATAAEQQQQPSPTRVADPVHPMT